MQNRLMPELQQLRWPLEQLLRPLRGDRGELLASWFLGFHPCVCVLFLEYFSDSMFLRFSLAALAFRTGPCFIALDLRGFARLLASELETCAYLLVRYYCSTLEVDS